MTVNKPTPGAAGILLSLKGRGEFPFSLLLVIRYMGWFLLAFIVFILFIPDEPHLEGGLLWWSITFFVYQLIKTLVYLLAPKEYDLSWFRMVRIQVNIGFMSTLIALSGGASSYFWVTFFLPILQTVLYFDQLAIPSVIFAEILLVYFLICFNVIVESGQANFLAVIVNNAVLLIVFSVLYYLVKSLRTWKSLVDLGLLHQVRQSMDTVWGIEFVEKAALEESVTVLGATCGSLLLVDREKKTLKCEHIIHRTRAIPGYLLDQVDLSGNVIEAWVARNQKPYRSGNVKLERMQPATNPVETLSILSVPVFGRGRLLGVLTLCHDKKDYFKESDEDLSMAIALTVGIVLEREQLLDSLQKVLHILNSSLERDTLGQVILSELGRVIEYKKATIQIFRGDKRKLVAYAGFGETSIDKWLLRPISKDPLICRIVKSKLPLIVANTSDEKDWEVRPGTRDVKSWVGVPLQYEGRVIGVLTLDHDQSDYYREPFKDILEVFGGQAALALSNWQRLKEESKLYETSMEITQEIDLDGLLKKIVRRATELLDASGGGFYICDHEKKQVRITVVHNITEEIVGQTIRFGEGMAGRVVDTGEPNKVTNYQEWSGAASVFTEGRWKGIFESVVEVPVKWKNLVIGVLFIIDEVREFTDDDVGLLDKFAGQAAIAINNATLLGHLKEIVDTAFDAIMQVDEHGFITHFNPSAERILGYTSNEIIGTKVYKLYCKGYEEAREIQGLLEKHGAIKNRPSCVKSKDGRHIDILFSCALLRNNSGKSTGSVGFFEDISEVKALKIITNTSLIAFKAVSHMSRPEDLQELLKTIVSETWGLFDADAAAILLRDDDAIVCPAYVGYTQDEIEKAPSKIGEGLVGKVLNDAMPIAVPDVENEPNYVLVSPDVRSELNVPIIGRSGAIGVLHVASHQLKRFREEDSHTIELCEILAGHAAVAIQHVESVQEREETQERLLQNASAVAVGRLAAGVGHEIKNSLNSIALSIGNVATRIEAIQGLSGQKEILDKIRSAEFELEQLADIATRLHKLSQEWEPEKELVNLNNLLCRTIKLLFGTFEKHQCSNNIHLDPKLDHLNVLLDERQIQQVIVNITLNALDASSRGQRVDYITS